jgi:2-oxoglutarate dehydrogenase E1 component
MYGGRDRRGMRKPLVVFTPKSLLRHPHAVSRVEDFTVGGFAEMIPEERREPVSRVVFCSGKVYYDLLAGREASKANHVAIVRVEQLYPFEERMAAAVLAGYPANAEVVWVQEEPRNMGPWRFMREHLQPLLDESGRELRYVGRPESASPATGSGKRHQQEQAALVADALTKGPIGETARVRLVARK